MKKILLALLLVVPFSFAFAHGEGITFSKTVDGVYVDVDYSTPEIVALASSGRFSFALYGNEERLASVPFTDVWVRISETLDGGNERTVFAGSIYNQEFGGAGFIFTFPNGGKYSLHTRFSNNGEKIVETEFPLEVEHADSAFSLSPLFWVGLVLGLGVAGGGAFALRRRKSGVEKHLDHHST